MDGRSSLVRRRATGRLAEACAALGADLLALQEIECRSVRSGLADQYRAALRAVVRAVPDAPTVADAHLRPGVFAPATTVGVFGRYGIALICPGGLENVETVRLPGRARFEPRVAIHATAHLRVGPTSVATTHLSRNRAESADQLCVVLDLLMRRPPPHVLLGDLNRRPHEVDDLLLAAGLRRVGAPPTYPAERPRLAIDVIAVRGLGCAAVLTPGPGISDHLPVAADLHVSPPDHR